MASRISRFLKKLLGSDSGPKPTGLRAGSHADTPSGPDTANARAYEETVFARLRDEGGCGGFPILYRYLSRNDEPRREEAYALLGKILATASGGALWRLDALCRERTSLEWDWERNTYPLDGFIPDGIGAEDKVWGYALASFHSDGYLREKAVIALDSVRTGAELPFLLLRLHDWVDEVRARAEAAVEARLREWPQEASGLNGENGMHGTNGDAAARLLKSLPILKRLRDAGRRSHAAMLDRIGRLIASDPVALRSGLASAETAETKTRRYVYGLALGLERVDVEMLQEAVLKEPEGPVRLFVLRSLEKRLTFPQAGAFIDRMIRDPFSPVKRHALDIRCKHALDESGNILREMIFSMNAGVRQTARYHMDRAGGGQPAAWYRKALAGGDGKALVGALRGLGEVGDRQDAERLHPFLKHERVMVVRAAIRSLASLQASYLATLLAPFVLDPRPGVSREAASSLKSRTSGLNPEKLNAARKASPFPHVRKNILTLLFAIGFWESLPYILEALAEVHATGDVSGDTGANAGEKAGEKAAQKDMAEKALAKWIQRSNAYFVKPGPGLKERGAESMARFGHGLDGRTRKTLGFILR